MKLGPADALPEKRSQVYRRSRLSYLNGVSLRNERRGLGDLGVNVITDLTCKSSRTDGLIIAAPSDDKYFDFRMTCVAPGADGAPPRVVLQSRGTGVGGMTLEYYRENSAYAAWQAAQQAKIDAAKTAWYPAAQAGAPIPPEVLKQMQIFFQGLQGTQIMNYASNITTPNFAAYRVTWNGMTFVFIPGTWNAGGGGTASLNPNVAQPLGGSPIDMPMPLGPGYIFAYDPRDKIGAPGAGSQLQYQPGTGSTAAKDIASIAAVVALPFVAAGITALAAGGAAAGAAGGAGAVMPGATAAASGATGGIIAEGAGAIMPGAVAAAGGATGGIVASAAPAVATAGGGLTTAGVIGAAKTAAGVVSAVSSGAGVVSKLATLVGQHSDAADALAQQAQNQADAGNVAAAAALQKQAQDNAAAAAYYQQQAGFLMPGFLSQSIGGVPLWAIALAAFGAVGLYVTRERK